MSRAVRKITGIVEVAAEPPADLEAVDVGQADVQHDEAGPVIGDRPETVLAVAGLHDPISVAAQVQLHQVGNVRLVVDDEDRPAFHAPSSSHSATP